jgi:hypothetical protein
MTDDIMFQRRFTLLVECALRLVLVLPLVETWPTGLVTWLPWSSLSLLLLSLLKFARRRRLLVLSISGLPRLVVPVLEDY